MSSAGNRLGISSLALVYPFTMDDLELLRWAGDEGFDVFEVCVSDPDALDPDVLRETAAASGLALSISGDFGPDRDAAHADAAVRVNASAYLFRCINFTAEAGASIFAGPMYSAVGKSRWVPAEVRAAERDRAVRALSVAAEHASTRGVRLAVEPLNRFETDLLNTVEQALELLEAIGAPDVGLMLDTFHMNIEEKNQAEAIEKAGPAVFHFQASENDRGTPGSGAVPWPAVAAALRSIEYRGDIVIESFVPTQELADGAAIWRPPAATMRTLATDGLRFLREQVI